MSQTKHGNEHGNMQSYAIGFFLSLVFTLIPYFMVVNHTIAGTALQVTIIGFAVLQMIIQITFFLHIGRGPKPNWNLFFFAATAGIIIFVVGASIMIMNRLHYNMAPSDQTKKIINDEGIYQLGGELTGACQEINANHQIVFINGLANPTYTEAEKCDTLTFVNEDEAPVELNFGTYLEREVYAGQIEIIVKNGRTETITLSESGSFQFYNQSQPETAGVFVVNP